MKALDLILEILKWLIPVGGLSGLLFWSFTKAEKELKALRDEHNTYKKISEDLQKTVEEDIVEKRRLRNIVSKFERAFSKAVLCEHYDKCPIDKDLRQYDEEVLNKVKDELKNN